MTLIDRIEAAEGPDRELDAAIHIALYGDIPFGTCWPFKPKTTPMLSEYVAQFRDVLNSDDAIPSEVLPYYTASIDAALTLLPEGDEWSLAKAAYGKSFACIDSGDDRVEDFKAYAQTPALALSSAILKAKDKNDE